jgi:hypothetical protein
MYKFVQDINNLLVCQEFFDVGRSIISLIIKKVKAINIVFKRMIV